MDGFGSLPLNLSSVPFTGRFEPGCRTEKKKSVHNVAVYRDLYANERQNESGKRSM